MRFAVIGGDKRMVNVARLLREEGHTVSCFAMESELECAETLEEAAFHADCVILPLPVKNEHGGLNAPFCSTSYDLETILSRLPGGLTVCGGLCDKALMDLGGNLGLNIIDYFHREELVVMNAALTVEGAISVLLDSSPISILESRVLVIGAGRIGKMLAQRLREFGAVVSVSSRKAGDMAHVRAMGCTALDTRTLDMELSGFDTIVNTVPFVVLDELKLRRLRPDTLIIDLASKPGGIDFGAAQALGLKALWALGLPSKTAPLTAGRIIKETVMNILSEV